MDPSVVVIINAIPNPDKLALLEQYVAKVMALHVAAGAEPMGRYTVKEQVGGTSGTKMVALIKYPSLEALHTVINGAGFQALSSLRAEVYLSVDMLVAEAV